MTFPEWIAANSTWWERFWCRWIGHLPATSLKGPAKPLGFCYRCGSRIP